MEAKNSAFLNSTICKKKNWLENQVNYLFFIHPLYVHFLPKMNLNYLYPKEERISKSLEKVAESFQSIHIENSSIIHLTSLYK